MKIYLMLIAFSFSWYACNNTNKVKENSDGQLLIKKQESKKNISSSHMKCETIYKSPIFIYKMIDVDKINKIGINHVFLINNKLNKRITPNQHDPSITDTIYNYTYKDSFIELAKPYKATNNKSNYSSWIKADINNKGVTLSNGLKIGNSRHELGRILGQDLPLCDTLSINTEDMTYENYLILKDDTLRRIKLAVAAD